MYGNAGSSPLTRGKQVRRSWSERLSGLIPAHAGKTTSTSSRASSAPAHPRSRGENKATDPIVGDLEGSSPLTRGKQVGAGFRRVEGRLIPAHAGKTYQYYHDWYQPRAHPRSRGENNGSIRALSAFEGSSPLTRGKLCPGNLAWYKRRLIPAHAGKTSVPPRERGMTWAHPRSRGENTRVMRAGWLSPGSSPLTRGKQPSPRWPCTVTRLIPAHAGKTASYTGPHAPLWAHPRSRGENRQRPSFATRHCGSSPLTRGKRISGLDNLGQIRLIPAHAGKTG